MSAPRARVVPVQAAQPGKPLLVEGVSGPQRNRIAREELEGRLAGERLLQQAQEKAEEMLARAREEATIAARRAADAAREEADAQLAARWLALRQTETDRLGREEDRIVSVAVVLAERLLGAALELAPARIADLARVVLEEARGARRAAIEAHPTDAQALRRDLQAAGLAVQAVEIRESGALARGELVLHTDLGTIDAKLASRLDRLAEALRDALK